VDPNSEIFNPFRCFLRHVCSCKTILSPHTLQTFESVLTIVEIGSAPEEVLKAVAYIQDTAESNVDSGLASIVVGLSQGKSLLRQARSNAEEKAKSYEFLEALGEAKEKATGAVVPSGKLEDWSSLVEILNDGASKLSDVVANKDQNPVDDIVKTKVNQSKHSIASLASSMCLSYAKHTVSEWLQTLSANWDSDVVVRSLPSLNLPKDMKQYNVLGNATAGLLKLTQHLELTLVKAMQTRHKSKDGSLDATSAVNAATEYCEFMTSSLEKMNKFSMTTPKMEEDLEIVKNGMVALSDSHVSFAAKEKTTMLGDLMVKARATVLTE